MKETGQSLNIIEPVGMRVRLHEIREVSGARETRERPAIVMDQPAVPLSHFGASPNELTAKRKPR